MGIAPRGSTFSTSPQRDGKSQPYTDYTGRFPLPPVDWNPIGRESLGPPDVQRNTNFRGLFFFFAGQRVVSCSIHQIATGMEIMARL
jgi:hypothetical protein